MQWFEYTAIGIAVFAALVLVYLVWCKWGQLRLLDLAAMPKAKLRSKKYQLIEGRLQRRASTAVDVAAKVSKPVVEQIKAQSKKIYDTVVALERKYRRQVMTDLSQEDKEKTRQKISQMLEKGAELYKEENYADAEHIFLDIIRINANEVEAFEYLGEIYMQRREFDEAIGALEHAKKLSPEDDRISFDLGSVYVTRGELERAKRYFAEAVQLAPTNPRNIDALLRLAIDMNDADTAQEMLNAMKAVNPENQKLQELQQTIADIRAAGLVASAEVVAPAAPDSEQK